MEQVKDDWRRLDLTAAEYAMLEFVEKLTLAPSAMREADVRKLRDAGFQAFLVGEHLMKSPDPARAVELLRQ